MQLACCTFIYDVTSCFQILIEWSHFSQNNQSISLEEAYKILNLDSKKKYTKEQILKSYKKIMKKIHPDVSPELTRLASIVNEAKEIVLKDAL